MIRRTAIAAAIIIIIAAGTAVAVKNYRSQYRPLPTGPDAYTGCPAGSGCGVTASNNTGCCRGGGAGQVDAEGIKALAERYYISKYGDRDVTIEVQDFGCHQEAQVIKNGTVVKKLTVSGSNVYESG